MSPVAIAVLKGRLGKLVSNPHVPLSDATVKALASMSLDGRNIYCSGWVRGSYIPAIVLRRKSC